MKKADRQKVFDKYGGKCYLCGCDLDNKWQVDHMVSKQYAIYYNKQDSVNEMDNLMPACKECNHYKRALCVDAPPEFRIIIGFREYMSTFHTRFAKYPKTPTVESSIKRKAYMQCIADKYNITPDNPFSGMFYFDTHQAIVHIDK